MAPPVGDSVSAAVGGAVGAAVGDSVGADVGDTVGTAGVEKGEVHTRGTADDHMVLARGGTGGWKR
jgi:hypothetical protein